MLEREIAILEKIAKHGNKVVIFSYSSCRDSERACIPPKHRESIEVVCAPSCFGSDKRIVSYLYLLALFFVNMRVFGRLSVIRSNQFSGVFPGMLASMVLGVPLLARSGFHYSNNSRYEKGYGFFLVACIWERLIVRVASVVACSAPLHYSDLVEKFGRSKIRYIPNYIIDQGIPSGEVDSLRRNILVCGRYSGSKNYEIVFLAAMAADVKVTVIVDDAGKRQLGRLAHLIGCDVEFLAPRKNSELIELMQRTWLFLQLPLYEGMPKTLLEAMYYCPNVLTWAVEGVNKKILFGDNVVLVDPPDFHDVVCAIKELMSKPSSSCRRPPSLAGSENDLEICAAKTIDALLECIAD